MENKVSKELAWHRLEQAKEDIMACDLLLMENYINQQIIEPIMLYFTLLGVS